MVTNSLNMGQGLKERLGKGDGCCSLCNGQMEKLLHIFKSATLVELWPLLLVSVYD